MWVGGLRLGNDSRSTHKTKQIDAATVCVAAADSVPLFCISENNSPATVKLDWICDAHELQGQGSP
jgi:hypothetical protein